MTLLVCSGFYGSAARAIDDVDNSIEVGGHAPMRFASRSRFGMQWIKFTITPPEVVEQKLGGAPLEIPCEVIGSRSPTLQWVVGNVPLSDVSGGNVSFFRNFMKKYIHTCLSLISQMTSR